MNTMERMTDMESMMRASPSLAERSVLVLEDNEFQRVALAAMLKELGVRRVLVAASGGEALDKLDACSEGIDVVLCDLQVTGRGTLDGIEFLRLAARRPIGALALVSGLEDDLLSAAEALVRGSGIPWGGCLRKPFARDELLELLSRCPPASLATSGPACAPRRPARNWSLADLRTALRREQFVPLFQPKICLRTGRLAGVEALARWCHPEQGMIPPAAFVPIMERERMIDALFDSILRRSLDAIDAWSRAGLSVPVALNASPLTLEDVGLPNRLRALVEERGIDPGMLAVEVTETAVAQDFHGLLESVTRMRMHGFGVSLDDFGTGYSSLQQLSELPVTEVKIDRSFVIRASRSLRSLPILETIVSLGHQLGLAVVAEGVETAELANFVRTVGCDTGQGYYFGAALSSEELQVRALRGPHFHHQ